MVDAFAAVFAIGLAVGVAVTLILTHRPRKRRRKRDVSPVRPEEVTGDLDPARMTPAQAMAHATADPPAETARLDTTIALEAPTEPTEPLQLEQTTTTLVEPWRPPDPRVVLTVTWKRDNAPLVAGRYDVTTDMPGEIVSLYHAMRHQQQYDGGTITVAVKLDGRRRDDWEWTANQEWPRQQIDAVRQAREQVHTHA